MSKSDGFWKYHHHLSKVILILIILYCVSSIFVLGAAYGIVAIHDRMYLHPDILVAYSIISFGVALFISAYHLSTMLRRRKRRCDRIPDIERLCGGRRIYPNSPYHDQPAPQG